MSNIWFGAMLIAVGALVVSAAEDEKETKPQPPTKLSDCPEAVQKTIKRESLTAKVEGVTKEGKGAEALYTAEVKIDGKRYEIRVANDGALLEKEWQDNDQVEVKFAKCPPAVQKTMKREAFGSTIDTVSKETIYGQVVYEAEVEINKKKYQLSVTDAGLLVTKKIQLDEAPPDPN